MDVDRRLRVKHNPARYAALAASLLIIATIVAECGLRFMVGLGTPVLVVRDSSCEYLEKPDQDVRRFFHHIRINHFGMRSDEVVKAVDVKSIRLLFVGDSLTYGTSRVDQDAIFTERLHRALPMILHRPVEVLNASAGGWAVDNELSYLVSRGIFGSNVVLLVLNSGDLAQARSTLNDVDDALFTERPGSALGELYERFARPWIVRRMGATMEGIQTSTRGTGGKEARVVVAGNLARLDRIQELVVSQSARLIVVYVPFRKDIPALSERSAVMLRNWCGAHGVAMIDTTTAEAARSLKQITLRDGIHLNASGHAVVAEAIEQWCDRSVRDGRSIGY